MSQNLVLGGPYDVPAKGKLVLGQLYSMTWRAPYTSGLTDVWRERCREYWERVEQRFGIIVTERRDVWAVVEGVGPTVTTFAVPMVKLKGDRIPRPRVSETVQ